MPLRSPKMYFCILGFQRLVWWPKCTPASSNSFIVRAAMRPPLGCPPPRGGSSRSALRPPDRWVRGVCDGSLRRVLAVDPHVLLGQVAGPDPILTPPQPEVDRDVVGLRSHDLPNPVQAHSFFQQTPLHQGLVPDGEGDPVLLDPGGRLADGHHDPAPVRVVTIDGGLDQGGV